MIGNYRTPEGETLDIDNKKDRQFLEENYPAIMANRPVGMSNAYQFMPTWKMASNLQNQFGMGIVEVGQQFSRKRDPSGQEHFVKFRMPESHVSLTVGDSVPELVLFNSHNGRSTVRAYAGVFRMVCANGMVVSTESFGQLNVRHFGEQNSYEVFSSLLAEVASKFKTLDERLNIMRDTILSIGQQHQLANMVMSFRKSPAWLLPEMVISHHRKEDEPVDDSGRRSLWTTFNVIQENLTNRDDVSWAPEQGRRRFLRPLTGARANILTNEAIWNGLEQWLTRNVPELAVVENTLTFNKQKKVEKPQQKEEAPAELVVAEDAHPEQAPQEEHVLLQEDHGVRMVEAEAARREELGAMKQVELREMCKLNEIKGYGNMKKVDMIDAVVRAEMY